MFDLTAAGMDRAWEHVSWNHGCPGVDGVTVERFAGGAKEGLRELREEAASGLYRPLPMRLLVVEKSPTKKEGRKLAIPCIRDRVLQTAVAHRLARQFEEEFLEVSFAYRPGRGVDTAVARIVQLRERGWVYAVCADIRQYFDSIPHLALERMVDADQAIEDEYAALLKLWIRAEVWDGRRVAPIRRGVPQGSPISPLMANLFLEPADEALSSDGEKFIRYADDLLILSRTAEGAKTAMGRVRGVLSGLGLALNEEKSHVTTFDEGFTYLGVRFQGKEASIPWKAPHRRGRVLFAARPMPASVLGKYRLRGPQPVAKRRRGPSHPAGSAQEKQKTKWSSGMPFLYVSEQGAVVRKSGERFLVEGDGSILFDVPCHRLEQILVFGNVQITSQAMAEALDHGIGVSLFTRQGRYRGALSAPPGHNVLLRLAQYDGLRDRETATMVARETVRWKIESEIGLLEKYADRGEQPGGVAPQATRAACDELEDLQAGLDGAGTVPEIEGHEGAAAKVYFTAAMAYNRSELEWPGRERHPAKDPLNALLSLTYTLLMHELSACCSAEGLDPGIGFLHEVDGSRPSLALDMMEAFRAPLADHFVLNVVNRQQIGRDDFEARDDHGGVFLKPDAMRRFFEAYEKWMLGPAGSQGVTLRAAVWDEPHRFAAFLRGRQKDPAMLWKPWVLETGTEEAPNAVAG